MFLKYLRFAIIIIQPGVIGVNVIFLISPLAEGVRGEAFFVEGCFALN